MKGHIKRFFLSFTPRYFKSYWLSREGLVRLGKLAGAGVLFVFLVFLWYAKDLPTPGKINSKLSAQTTKFYDSSEKHLLYELLGDKNRSIIKYDDIPAVAKNATLAIEDKDFYKHGSFSVWGYLRAAIENVTTGTHQGGSTITQQYVKNALLDPTDFSYSRKIKELILSIEIGQFYSKHDILTLYLNEIPYGARAYGIESACKTFFPQDIDKADPDQRCAKNLNLSQSALLAAILNGPSYYSPYGSHTDLLIERQHLVLDLMVEQKYVSKADADAARWTEADLSDSSKISQVQNLYANLDPRMAHFVLYAQEYLEGKYGAKTVTEGGLKVVTTLDYDKQIAAYDAVQANMGHVKSLGGSNAAVVSTDPKNGHILAMIGSADFNGDKKTGQVNVATSLRQPGSSFKPIVYSAMFAKNKDASCAKDRSCSTYGPGTTLYDVPTNFGSDSNPYIPQNYGNKTYGVTTARSALAGSLNRPAVKALAIAGIPSALQTAQSLGISTLKSSTDYGLSLVLGSGEVELTQMANAYESFANGGLHYEQTPILKLYDQKGKVMEDNTKPKKGKQALDPQVATLMSDVLSDTNAKKYVFANDLVLNNICANNNARNCVHAGVKTGTTEHYNDAWTVGFTPDITGGVWVGNNDNAPMNSAAADIAAPIWRAYMNKVTGGKPTEAFAKAPGIKTVTLDKRTGRAVTAGTKETTVDIFPSWYVPMTSTGGKNATIDKVSGKLATECTPDLAKDTVYSSAITPELLRTENPTQYQNWLSALQKAGYSTSGGDLPTESDDKHHCDDDKPTVNITGANGGGPYNFTVHVTSGTFPANKLQVYFDDQIVSTQVINGSGSYDVSCSDSCSDLGSHTFKAVVTDAGYYQGTDTQTVNVTNSGGGSFSGITPDDGASVSLGSVLFKWSDNGASSYTLHVDGLTFSTTSTQRSITVVTPGNHTWWVVANNGDQTDHYSFTAH